MINMSGEHALVIILFETTSWEYITKAYAHVLENKVKQTDAKWSCLIKDEKGN